MKVVTKYILQIFFSLFLIVTITACVSSQQELQMILKQHNFNKQMFIKNTTVGYDRYLADKKAVDSLKRGTQYEIVDIKQNYAKLKQTSNNTLKQNLWVDISNLEKNPTYFVRLNTNAPSAKIVINNIKYEPNMRLLKGFYKVTVSADMFLDKHLEINILKDTTLQIDLDFDIEAQKIEELKQQKRAILKAKIKKASLERKESVYKDTIQNLMWQDDKDTKTLQKPWITQVNYENSNFQNTDGDTAVSYCENLNLAGFTNWRVPTKEELKKLYEQKHSLKNITSDWYWSSSSNETLEDRAWAIYLNNADGYSDYKNTLNYIRCVR